MKVDLDFDSLSLLLTRYNLVKSSPLEQRKERFEECTIQTRAEFALILVPDVQIILPVYAIE